MRRSTSYIDTIDTSNPDFESLVNVVRRTIKTVNMRNRETARCTGLPSADMSRCRTTTSSPSSMSSASATR